MTNDKRKQLSGFMEGFKRWMGAAGDLVALNLLMLLTFLPIITAGAGIVAGYTCLLRVVRGQGEGLPIRSFFQAFAVSFKKTLPVWLLVLGCFCLLGLDFYFAVYVSQPVQRTFMVLAIVLAVLAACVAEWLFPLMARFENTRAAHLKNAALMAVARFPKTLLALVLTVGWWLVPLCISDAFLYLGWVWLAFGLSLPMYVTAYLFRRELQCQYEPPEDADEN